MKQKLLNLFQDVEEQHVERRLKTTDALPVCVVCGDKGCSKRECINIQTALTPADRVNQPDGLSDLWKGQGFCTECGYDYWDCICHD